MRIAAIVGVALLGSCSVAPIPASAPRPAAELAGLTPGPPERCVPIQPDAALHVDSANPGMLIYRAGSTVWANDVTPCRFNANDVLVIQPLGISYCQGDIVKSFEPSGMIQGPSCTLRPFVPYRR